MRWVEYRIPTLIFFAGAELLENYIRRDSLARAQSRTKRREVRLGEWDCLIFSSYFMRNAFFIRHKAKPGKGKPQKM